MNGNPVALAGAGLPEGAIAWASLGDAPVAVGTWRGGALHPTRVFALP